jgi:predicted nucleic acid-binding protein
VKRAFGDAQYFLALLSPRDQDHARAKEFAKHWRGEIITTRWILAEVADGLAAPPLRAGAIAFLKRMEANPFVRIIPTSEAQFARGFELYQQRRDKAWSLTDCISFISMADEHLTDALTRDRHFGQAGFRALLA